MSSSVTTSGGSTFSTAMLWPATWLRIRCFVNSGPITSCANSPGCIRSSIRHERLPPGGSAHSIAHSSPSPRTSRTVSNSSTSGCGQLEQLRAEPRRVGDETLLVELVQRREPGRHRQLVRRERRAVADRVLHRVEHGLVHRARHQQRADRHVAAGERLRDGHEIRLEPPVLEREHLPGAPEAGLHLVDAEERAVAAADLLRALEVARRRQVDALALHRLDEEDRDVLAAQLLLERVEVAERNALEPRQQRPEPVRELRVAVRRERAERQPVEARGRRR